MDFKGIDFKEMVIKEKKYNRFWGNGFYGKSIFTVLDFKKMVLKEMEFEDKTIMDFMEMHLNEKNSNGFYGIKI